MEEVENLSLAVEMLVGQRELRVCGASDMEAGGDQVGNPRMLLRMPRD